MILTSGELRILCEEGCAAYVEPNVVTTDVLELRCPKCNSQLGYIASAPSQSPGAQAEAD